MNNRGESTVCIVKSNEVCIATELFDLIYNKVEKNQVLRIKTMKEDYVNQRKRKNKQN